MSNLTKYGTRYLSKYLRDYAKGIMTLTEVKAYLNCCFEVR